ncbi:MAG: pyridoxal-phosphate dependent enzyme [Deltaproteobacteria bacterium]|nr:pyridoxal-phosphate dependent enzyme [Deltaproteobacteria bacterium]
MGGRSEHVAVKLQCTGCGREVGLHEPRPFSCPAAVEGDDIDHVLVRRLDPSVPFPVQPDVNPYLGFSRLMSQPYRAAALGLPPTAVETVVRTLDEAIGRVDGGGFVTTPWAEQVALARRVGASDIRLWAKDETGNVSGSHKARHLMGVMIHLLLAEHAGLTDAKNRAPLAIASCGNAALAAAVVAAAAAWPLEVFVPTDADPVVLSRLHALGASVNACPRDGQPGDPCYRALTAAVQRGAVPFTVQGSDNGLAVEGGLTLGYELAHQVRQGPGQLDVLVIQVGGGALGSACVHALRDAVARGVLPHMPRICTVQTTGAWPLRRAHARVVQRAVGEIDLPSSPRERADALRHRPAEDIERALRHAATHRAAYMWPWEGVPHSIAHGILDDETYDWWSLVEGMVQTGGWPIVADEQTLAAAHTAVRETTEVLASPTGTAGVAGVIHMAGEGSLRPGEIVGVLLTGRARA